MSRWKNTLCGSMIKQSDSGEVAKIIPSHTSEVLSCGGKFLPQAQPVTPHLSTHSKPIIVNLPTENSDMLIFDSHEFVHLGGAQDPFVDDLDVIEDAFYYLDTKLFK